MRVLASQASHLGKAFVDERFSLRQKLNGQKEIEPRWKRCVQSADGALGELLAQEYVREKFDAASKQAAEDLIKSVRHAMKAELGSLAWMDAATRTAAEGQMTPPTVNAYYDSSLNEMVFPAGILQPPFFDKGFAAAVNFGSTGAVMGHELTHGFDDEGSQFDGLGNLRNWWSDVTSKQFKEETRCVIDQYGAYEALPGVKLNGELTLGENIADIGGLKLAFSAFKDAQKASTERIASDGYTEEQLFFLAYGQSWCEKDRPEVLDLMVKTNPHAPTRFRVDGVVSDVPAFADAFACKEGTPMRPAKICAVW
jgi:predicted metalloendopeptidase